MRPLEKIEYFTKYPRDGIPRALPYHALITELKRTILFVHQFRYGP